MELHETYGNGLLDDFRRGVMHIGHHMPVVRASALLEGVAGKVLLAIDDTWDVHSLCSHARASIQKVLPFLRARRILLGGLVINGRQDGGMGH